ncbi:MAG: hypothetical protein A2X33_10240 [Elusimicrobia bacterium GWA2_51_34]|nr:MAG: hypothetical protein A2X33_10240 [Elusimicrobia bacterium GWA2_51_34]
MTAKIIARNYPVSTFRSFTLAHFLPSDFYGAEFNGLAEPEFENGVFRLVKKNSRTPEASLVSREIKAAFPFNELLMSANSDLGQGGTARIEARVKTADGWSPWFNFGLFQPGAAASVKGQENKFGKMDVDILKLKTKAFALSYRFTLGSRAEKAALRLISAAYSDTTLPFNEPAAVKKGRDTKPLKLAVPSYSQMRQHVSYSGDICSPVSLAMVMNYYGQKELPLETAAAVLDGPENIYGNWTFNTAYAGSKGLYAFLTRINSIAEAEAYLSRGITLIASVTFGPDELKNSPLKKTKGHLLVIKGFDAKGNVLANDPAAPEEKTVERVYNRGEFARAWLKNKYGTAYAVSKNLNAFLAVTKPFTEMFSTPPANAGERKKLIETQLLLNEPAAILDARGQWAKIEAGGQKTAGAKDFKPYSGWVKLEDLAFFPPLEPDAVVKVKKSAAAAGGESKTLSLGTEIKITGERPGKLEIITAGGITAEISEKDINRLPLKIPAPELRRNILATAGLFLNDSYYWGGRSAWGVDCSGLVNLSYRAWGAALPRNAADQFNYGKSVSRENLKPADLIFSSKKNAPGNINHVMLYAGAGRLIESTQDTGSVREVSFKEKFGVDLARTKNGALINGKKIFFKTVLK